MPETFKEKLRQFEMYVQKNHNRKSIWPQTDGLTIPVRYQEHPIVKGWIDMVVVINRQEVITQLRKTEMMQWIEERREWLDDFQGPSDGAKFQIIEEILREVSKGKPPGEIRKALNSKIAALLKEPITKQQIVMMKQMSGDDLPQYLRAHPEPQGGILQAAKILIVMGFNDPNDRDFLDLLRMALENIAFGHEPFLPGEPIDRNRMNNRLKEWRKGSV